MRAAVLVGVEELPVLLHDTGRLRAQLQPLRQHAHVLCFVDVRDELLELGEVVLLLDFGAQRVEGFPQVLIPIELADVRVARPAGLVVEPDGADTNGVQVLAGCFIVSGQFPAHRVAPNLAVCLQFPGERKVQLAPGHAGVVEAGNELVRQQLALDEIALLAELLVPVQHMVLRYRDVRAHQGAFGFGGFDLIPGPAFLQQRLSTGNNGLASRNVALVDVRSHAPLGEPKANPV